MRGVHVKRPIVEVASIGKYTPAKVLSNADLEKMVDTTDAWIRERTGIAERRIADDSETLAFMSKQASLDALSRAGVSPEELDVIVLGTASPDRLLPSTACELQAELGATNAAAFDIGAACSGFLYGLTVAEGMIYAGQAKNVLVVGGERLSRIVNYEDRATCILFGDGAGASLVRPVTDSSNRGVLSSYLKSDGRLAELLYRPGGGANEPPSEKMLQNGSYFLHMAGREVFKHAVKCMADACAQALDSAGLSRDDVDLMIPHQANIRIIESTAKHSGIPMERVMVNVDRYGNTSAASIPIALEEALAEGRVGKGSVILLAAFGGGFTWASMVLRW
ncbi:MAG: ketoacyl-ACP synthase III [Gemmatimonadetes bacterium]|nr:ketoacyl-ACP synthase III [Gemmatimonadota bacterium]